MKLHCFNITRKETCSKRKANNWSKVCRGQTSTFQQTEDPVQINPFVAQKQLKHTSQQVYKLLGEQNHCSIEVSFTTKIPAISRDPSKKNRYQAFKQKWKQL